MKQESIQKLGAKLRLLNSNLASNNFDAFKTSTNELIDLIHFVEYSELKQDSQMSEAVTQTLKSLNYRE